MQQNGATPQSIVKLEGAARALAEAKDLPDILDIKDLAQAAAEYARAAKLGLEAQNTAAEIKLRAERKAGGLLAELKRGEPGPKVISKPVNNYSPYRAAIDSAGATYQDANRYQKVSSIPDDDFEMFVEDVKASGQELTTNKALKFVKQPRPHVSNNSGNNEWYTPPEYIEAARAVMGGIDLDPASSEVANRTVRAAKFYTAEDDGLAWDWRGRVWINPPYAQPLIFEFCQKLADDFKMGFIDQACLLVNNATETRWFNAVLERASAVCFVRGRIKFLDVDGNPSGAPLQGQVVLYMGKNVNAFVENFDRFGVVLYATWQN